jgi:hypothetical protein
LRIYKITSRKEAKLFDLFDSSREKLLELAKGFIGGYFEKSGKLPTVGDIILGLMKSQKNSKDQSLLKIVALSALSQFKSELFQA